jgi:putative endopeptidase
MTKAASNLAEWWTKEDAAKFEKRAEVMVKQFNAYEPLPGLHINGKASLGENIADYGGLLLGLDAFKKTDQYKEGDKIAGLTPLQRYFLGYALGWLDERREELLRRDLLSDVHAPPKWRVIGPLADMPEFYEAFGLRPRQGPRVEIW